MKQYRKQKIQNMSLSKKLFLEAILRTDLKSFIIKSFYTINPCSNYIDNWHVDLIADHLTYLECGKIKKLIINMPPRYLKSLCVNIAWSAWLLGKNPSNKIISASYSEKISTIHSINTRNIITSSWYKKTFPKTILSDVQNEKNHFQTTEHGLRFAGSIGGSITGIGADYLILDDPINPINSNNKKILQNTFNWFEKVFMTRLNNRTTGKIIIIMQRLHKEDISGILKSLGSWHVLEIPLIAEKNQTIRINNKIYKRKKGELLHKEYNNKKIAEELKIDIGTYNFYAQYQQNPQDFNSNIFKKEWFKFYKETLLNELADNKIITISWDTASSTNTNADYSVCSIWTEYKNNFILLNIYKERLNYIKLKETTITMAKTWNASVTLIENKSSGQQLIQELSDEINIIAINPTISKMARFEQIIPFFEKGLVLFPNKNYITDTIDEFISFPNGSYRDQIDSIAQYIIWKKNQNNLRIRLL